ncbi:hypothetical protein N7532_007493 [Penicillium argentinense]|uniref:Uncharacterized protein n=1 Tax=Penicillium argentinense TaxID=1131581 RepID=A0A9W9F7T5_9EURO|nr:uncharacterized protein N7532_007493 [Penicillium argentinense]KAJ5095202.1 hypothetical protein N7532_007493 [Penicillium argentinense]
MRVVGPAGMAPSQGAYPVLLLLLLVHRSLRHPSRPEWQASCPDPSPNSPAAASCTNHCLPTTPDAWVGLQSGPSSDLLEKGSWRWTIAAAIPVHDTQQPILPGALATVLILGRVTERQIPISTRPREHDEVTEARGTANSQAHPPGPRSANSGVAHLLQLVTLAAKWTWSRTGFGKSSWGAHSRTPACQTFPGRTCHARRARLPMAATSDKASRAGSLDGRRALCPANGPSARGAWFKRAKLSLSGFSPPVGGTRIRPAPAN